MIYFKNDILGRAVKECPLSFGTISCSSQSIAAVKFYLLLVEDSRAAFWCQLIETQIGQMLVAVFMCMFASPCQNLELAYFSVAFPSKFSSFTSVQQCIHSRQALARGVLNLGLKAESKKDRSRDWSFSRKRKQRAKSKRKL